MKTKSQELFEQESQKRIAAKAILDKTDYTDAELDQANTLLDEADAIKTSAVKHKAMEDRAAANEDSLKALSVVQRDIPVGAQDGDGTKSFPRVETMTRYGGLKHFKNNKEGELEAYRFGRWLLGGIFGFEKSQKWCADEGLTFQKAQSETVGTAGGYLVPDEFSNTLIDLREKYGVFRPNAKTEPMKGDTKRIPRRKAGLTTFYVGENSKITTSDKQWSMVTLTARKLAALTLFSTEVDEDVIINLADDLAGEIAYAFSLAEDQAGFLGDGTGTYGGITGLTGAFKLLGTPGTSTAGLVTMSGAGYGTNWNSAALADFNNLVGKLPQYAVTPNTAWYCSRTFWASVMQRLQLAAGGVTSMEIAGKLTEVFMGFPVRISQVLPLASAVNQLPCFFGDLSLAASFGDRRQTTIATSTDFAFDQDAVAIRGTERYDIVVHDVGNFNATASLQVPGPIVGLLTAAS